MYLSGSNVPETTGELVGIYREMAGELVGIYREMAGELVGR